MKDPVLLLQQLSVVKCMCRWNNACCNIHETGTKGIVIQREKVSNFKGLFIRALPNALNATAVSNPFRMFRKKCLPFLRKTSFSLSSSPGLLEFLCDNLEEWACRPVFLFPPQIYDFLERKFSFWSPPPILIHKSLDAEVESWLNRCQMREVCPNKTVC